VVPAALHYNEHEKRGVISLHQQFLVLYNHERTNQRRRKKTTKGGKKRARKTKRGIMTKSEIPPGGEEDLVDLFELSPPYGCGPIGGKSVFEEGGRSDITTIPSLLCQQRLRGGRKKGR